MNQEIKQRWLEALRSGEYKQGQEQLRWDDQFCCLGVLCDLHAKETGNKWEYSDIGKSYLGELEVLPSAVAEWAGLDESPKIDTRFGYDSVIDMNDSDVPFSEIADVIEAQL